MKQALSKGVEVATKAGKSSDKPGTYVEFLADLEIFKKFRYNPEMVERRIWHYAYLNAGLKIIFNGAPI